jgi:outer membrane protein assembly factor BamB
MANINSPSGLVPTRMIGGAPYTGGQSRYRVASATVLYQGDLCFQETAGTIGRHEAASTVPIIGVFNGCTYTDAAGELQWSNYKPAGFVAEANVIDDPSVVFSVQADAAFPDTELFGNFDIVDGSPIGNDKTGTSNMSLAVSTGATTATLPLKALDISGDPDNSDQAAAYANILVVIQNHVFGVKSAGLA